MIETDSYDMISDRLYLVPFLRRYATFLGLDAEEVASRFVSTVQHAEANVVRISQESRWPRSLRLQPPILFAVLVGAVILLLADFAWRHFEDHEASPAAVESPAAMASSAQAPNETLPPATAVTNPESAPPVSSGACHFECSGTGDRSARGESSTPPRPAPPAATDD